ncbi:hypothetical protein AS132_17445 [Photobacterium sanguinicancri]|nr:hypothetical protein AS132_17445 [Photobacterium sanguinicancri]
MLNYACNSNKLISKEFNTVGNARNESVRSFLLDEYFMKKQSRCRRLERIKGKRKRYAYVLIEITATLKVG